MIGHSSDTDDIDLGGATQFDFPIKKVVPMPKRTPPDTTTTSNGFQQTLENPMNRSADSLSHDVTLGMSLQSPEKIIQLPENSPGTPTFLLRHNPEGSAFRLVESPGNTRHVNKNTISKESSFTPGQIYSPDKFDRGKHEISYIGEKSNADLSNVTADLSGFTGAFEHHIRFPTPLHKISRSSNEVCHNVNQTATRKEGRDNAKHAEQSSSVGLNFCPNPNSINNYKNITDSPSSEVFFEQNKAASKEQVKQLEHFDQYSSSPDIMGIVKQLVSSQLAPDNFIESYLAGNNEKEGAFSRQYLGLNVNNRENIDENHCSVVRALRYDADPRDAHSYESLYSEESSSGTTTDDRARTLTTRTDSTVATSLGNSLDFRQSWDLASAPLRDLKRDLVPPTLGSLRSSSDFSDFNRGSVSTVNDSVNGNIHHSGFQNQSHLRSSSQNISTMKENDSQYLPQQHFEQQILPHHLQQQHSIQIFPQRNPHVGQNFAVSQFAGSGVGVGFTSGSGSAATMDQSCIAGYSWPHASTELYQQQQLHRQQKQEQQQPTPILTNTSSKMLSIPYIHDQNNGHGQGQGQVLFQGQGQVLDQGHGHEGLTYKDCRVSDPSQPSGVDRRQEFFNTRDSMIFPKYSGEPSLFLNQQISIQEDSTAEATHHTANCGCQNLNLNQRLSCSLQSEPGSMVNSGSWVQGLPVSQSLGAPNRQSDYVAHQSTKLTQSWSSGNLSIGKEDYLNQHVSEQLQSQQHQHVMVNTPVINAYLSTSVNSSQEHLHSISMKNNQPFIPHSDSTYEPQTMYAQFIYPSQPNIALQSNMNGPGQSENSNSLSDNQYSQYITQQQQQRHSHQIQQHQQVLLAPVYQSMQYQPSHESRYYPMEDEGAVTCQDGFKTHLSGTNVGGMDSRFLYLDNQLVNPSVQIGQDTDNNAGMGGHRSGMGTGWQYVGAEGLIGMPSLSSSSRQSLSFSNGDQLEDLKNLQSSLMTPINTLPFHSMGQSQLHTQSESLSLEGLCQSGTSFDSGPGLMSNQGSGPGSNARESGNTSSTVYNQVNGNGSYIIQLPSQSHQQSHLQTQQTIRQQHQQQQTHQHHLFHETLHQQNHHQKQQSQQSQQQFSRYSKQSQLLDRDRADRDKIEKDRASRSGKGIESKWELNITQSYTDTDYGEERGREIDQNQFHDSLIDGSLYDLKQNIQVPTFVPKYFINHQDKNDNNNNSTSGGGSSSYNNDDCRGTSNITGGNYVNSKNPLPSSFSLASAGPKEHLKGSYSSGRDRDGIRGEGDMRQSYEKCNQIDRRGSNTQGSNHQNVNSKSGRERTEGGVQSHDNMQHVSQSNIHNSSKEGYLSCPSNNNSNSISNTINNSNNSSASNRSSGTSKNIAVICNQLSSNASNSAVPIVVSNTIIPQTPHTAAHTVTKADRQELVESPHSKLAYKDFYRHFRSMERESVENAKAYAEDSLQLMPPNAKWRVLLELADLAKRSNDFEKVGTSYCIKLQYCTLQYYVIQKYTVLVFIHLIKCILRFTICGMAFCCDVLYCIVLS